MIEVDARNFEQKCRDTRKLFGQTQWEIVKMAEHFKDMIRSRTPYKTGMTRQSWTIHFFTSTDVISWVISPDGREQIITYLEWGTPRHVILPHLFPKGALAFDVDGDHVVTKVVIHPGMKPLGLVRTTQAEVDAHAKQQGEKLLSRISTLWGH